MIIKDGISELAALARILWGMTFYGYTEEDRDVVFGTSPRNIYEKKAEELRNRRFRNYAYGLANKFEMQE